MQIVRAITILLVLFPLPGMAADFKVVTTFTVIADMARNVAGDAAEVVSITRPGAEIHNYAPTPRDILSARDADLVLWNGLNLELWFERFFRNLNSVPQSIVSEGITPICIGDGPYAGKPNPHAWMSPESAMIYVVYFLTIVNGASVIVDTMPVNNEKSCVEIVQMINSQPSAGGRKVRAACYIKGAT